MNIERMGWVVLPLVVAACGGESSDGTGGAAGSGGGSSAVTCEQVCPSIVAAACPDGPKDQADCVAGCSELFAGSCAAQIGALLQCAGTSPAVSCGNDEVTLTACPSQEAALGACIEGMADAGAPPACEQVCPAVVAAQCTGGPPNVASCLQGCQEVATGPCSSQWSALLACGGTSPTFICLTSGAVGVDGCDSQNAALSTCLASR